MRLFHAIKGLSNNHDVHLFAIHKEAIAKEDKAFVATYTSSMVLAKISLKKRIYNAIKLYLTRKLPFQTGWTYEKETAKNLLEYADKIQPDIVFCQLTRMAAYAQDLPFPKVLDYMDAFSEGMARRASISSWFAKPVYSIEALLVKNYEKKVYNAFDESCIISYQDKQLLSFNSDQVHILANGVDTDYFHPVKEIKPQYDIGFIGNLGYLPNVEAVEYIHRHIHPGLPSKSILISGARPSSKVKKIASDNFTIQGWIDDIREAYKNIYIFVAPLFKGTGQQNKILEAMAMGIPCITTSMVNQSIGAEPGSEILIADSPRDYIEKLSLLQSDQELYNSLRERGRYFVVKNYQWENHVNELEKIFKKAIKKYDERRI